MGVVVPLRAGGRVRWGVTETSMGDVLIAALPSDAAPELGLAGLGHGRRPCRPGAIRTAIFNSILDLFSPISQLHS